MADNLNVHVRCSRVVEQQGGSLVWAFVPLLGAGADPFIIVDGKYLSPDGEWVAMQFLGKDGRAIWVQPLDSPPTVPPMMVAEPDVQESW